MPLDVGYSLSLFETMLVLGTAVYHQGYSVGIRFSHAFLGRYFPIHKQIAARDQILSFVQRHGEGFYDAWERYKDLIRRCPNHGLQRWLELQIFYRGLSHDARSFVDMAACGSITNKTLDDAFMHIETIAFHQFQWYGEKPSVDLLTCCYETTTTPTQPTPTQNLKSYSSCDKIDLAWVLFDDDDAIVSDTHMAALMDINEQDSVVLLDDSLMCEPILQSAAFDVEDPRLLDIDDMLVETEMEKFTFEYAGIIDSSAFEPEMEILMIDDDEDASDATSDIVPQETSTTTHPKTYLIKVVLELLKHLRYDFKLANKACNTIDIAYATCSSLLKFVHEIFYCYASIIGYSIEDLEGVSPVTLASCLLVCYFRLPNVLNQLQDEHVRVDIPWDPGGCMAW